MPPDAPLIPRKMLPPPTMIAISTPRSARALVTSAAIECTTSESMPNPIERSANASPESLSTTRRYLLSGIRSSSRIRVSQSGLGGSCPILRSVLADLDAGEPADRGSGTQALHQCADRLLLV